MPRIPYPNVPIAPGVPQLPRLATSQQTVGIITGQILSYLISAATAGKRWGIYDDKGNTLGNPQAITGIVAGFKSFLGLGPHASMGVIEFSKDTRVSDFPIEKGSFASYNKVEMSAEPAVTVFFTGSESDRTNFLNALNAACLSTDLYSIITPEVTYVGYTIQSYDYSRSAESGGTLLTVVIKLKEIRQVSAQFTNAIPAPKEANSSDPVTNGSVQPQAPSKSLLIKAFELLN